MMEIFTMECFICASDCESISKAAEKMCITQPAMSMQIKKLESDLHVRLINRTPRFSFLTEEGKLVYRAFSSILGTYHNMKWQLGQTHSDRKILRIGYHGPTDWANITDLFSGFMQDNPNIQIDVTVTELGRLSRMIDNGDLDVAIMLGQEFSATQDKDLVCVDLFREQGCFGMSADNSLAGRETIHTEDLTGHTIYMNSGGQLLQNYRPFEEAGISAENVVFVNGFIATIAGALANDALVIMPRSFKMPRQNLVYVDHDIAGLSVSFYAVCRRENLNSEISAFLNACRAFQWPTA